MTDLPFWFSATEIASYRLPGLPDTKREINRWLSNHDRSRPDKDGLWWRQRKTRGGGLEYNLKILPPPAQHALLMQLRISADGAQPKIDARAAAQRDVAWLRFSRLPRRTREKATRRLQALVAVRDRQAHGWTAEMAISAACTEFRFGKSAVYEWLARVRGVPREDWLAHLVDNHCGIGKSADCSTEAWEFFKADYLRPARPSAEACYRRLERVAAENGWVVPSSKTLKRRIAAMPLAMRVERREGERALKALYPAQQRDRGVFHAMEAVCADGHQLDVFVRWEDGTTGRPELLGFQDLFSGMILSWRIDRSENKEMIRLAFGDLVEEFGIPESCYLDNGRGFASKWISGGAKSRFRFKAKQDDPLGVMETLGVRVHFVTPYSGQSKPIERAWRDFADDISRDPRLAGAYTGPNPTEKPADYGSRAVSLDRLLSVIAEGVTQHNNRLGRRTMTCGGKLSFRQAFDASYSQSIIRKASAVQRQYWLLMAEVLTVRQPDASLHLLGNRYWCEALLEHIGKRVTVRFDPQSLQEDMQVYTLDDRFLASAPCVEAVGFNDVNAARDHSRKRRAWMRAVREVSELERGMTIEQVGAALDAIAAPPACPPESKIVRLVTRGNAAIAATAVDEQADGMSEADRLFLRGAAKLRLVREETEV